jgi:hypothetical protein
MKKKVGTVLDEDLLFMAKKTALDERKTLSRLLEDALKTYLNKPGRTADKRRKGVSAGTQGSMKISRRMLKTIMEEEGVYGS